MILPLTLRALRRLKRAALAVAVLAGDAHDALLGATREPEWRTCQEPAPFAGDAWKSPPVVITARFMEPRPVTLYGAGLRGVRHTVGGEPLRCVVGCEGCGIERRSLS